MQHDRQKGVKLLSARDNPAGMVWGENGQQQNLGEVHTGNRGAGDNKELKQSRILMVMGNTYFGAFRASGDCL